MSCAVTVDKKYMEEIEGLRAFYDVVIIEKDVKESVAYSVQVVKVHLSNKGDGDKYDEVFFDASIQSHKLKEVVSFFEKEASEIDESNFIKMCKDGYYIKVEDRHLPSQEVLEKLFLHFAQVLADGLKAKQIPLFEEGYSFKGASIAHEYDYCDNKESQIMVEYYEEVLIDGLSDLELYHYFISCIDYGYHDNKSFLEINYYLGSIGGVFDTIHEFSISNKRVISALREISGIPLKSFDEQVLIINTAVEYFCGFGNWDRKGAGLEEIDSSSIVSIAKRCLNAKEFKKAIADVVGSSSLNGGGGWGVGGFFGEGKGYEYSIDKPNFRIKIYAHNEPLVRGNTVNDGYLNFSDMEMPVGSENVVLFDSKEVNLYDLLWSYFREGVFTLKCEKDIVVGIEENRDFVLSDTMREQKEKIEGGASLFDLI